ncbi:hypothetical protein Tco_1067232 [Tanacetum coccineum]|uniref:Synaptobrevin, longin-like domain protein n=1 Tax=Tanacetum coccineum TaxID=301880 RepID=A0ABQ5HE28_9ASTR
MADLKFVDQHNMVACLERTEENAEFHQIVDFLTTSSIHYALTISPTIYASYIEQSDLHFNDEDGITCLTNTAIFENLALMGYENDSDKLTFQKALFSPQWKYLIHTILYCLSSKSTSWNEFSTNIASAVICLATGQKFNFSKLIFDGDEPVFKERDDRVVRATTTAASLDAAQASGVNTPESDEERNEQHDLTDFVPPTPYDSPLLEGHTSGSDEGRPNINELLTICINLLNWVLALEQSKTTQDLVINKMQKKVKRLEKALRARTLGMKLFKISTSRRKGLDKDNVSKQERKSDKTKPMFKDSDFDVLDDAMENVEGGSTAKKLLMLRIHLILLVLMSARPRITSVVIRNVEEEPMRATPVPTVQSQDKENKDSLRESKRMLGKRATKQEAKDAVLIEQIEDVQARMDADELLAARLQEQKREQFLIDEQARFLVENLCAWKKFFCYPYESK